MLEPRILLLFTGVLFALGLYGLLSRKNLLVMLMSLELMLNAVNIGLVTFSRYWAGHGAEAVTSHSGQFFTLMVMAVAAAEVGIGLAIIVAIYRRRQTSLADAASDLRH